MPFSSMSAIRYSPTDGLLFGRLEFEFQRHLNLARAADGFVHRSQAGGRVVKAAGTARGKRRRAHYWELVIELILRNVVDGDIEAGGVGHVEDIEAVLQSESLGELSELYERNVGTLLPGLAEDIALTRGEVGLEGVSRGDGAAQVARIQQGQSEAG